MEYPSDIHQKLLQFNSTNCNKFHSSISNVISNRKKKRSERLTNQLTRSTQIPLYEIYYIRVTIARHPRTYLRSLKYINSWRGSHDWLSRTHPIFPPFWSLKIKEGADTNVKWKSHDSSREQGTHVVCARAKYKDRVSLSSMFLLINPV